MFRGSCLDYLYKWCSETFRKIHRKHRPRSPFLSKVLDLQMVNLVKMDSNAVVFLRTVILWNTCSWLLIRQCNRLLIINFICISQLTCTCSKSAIETLERGVKHVRS